MTCLANDRRKFDEIKSEAVNRIEKKRRNFAHQCMHVKTTNLDRKKEKIFISEIDFLGQQTN